MFENAPLEGEQAKPLSNRFSWSKLSTTTNWREYEEFNLRQRRRFPTVDVDPVIETFDAHQKCEPNRRKITNRILGGTVILFLNGLSTSLEQEGR